MYTFEYDIRQDEEDGRPYIHIEKDYSVEPQHRFMAMELVAYSLNDLIVRYNNSEQKLDPRFMAELVTTSKMITELSGQLAVLIKEQDDSLNELKDILNNKNKDDNENNDGKDSI
jgi:hypothetical protein